MESASIVGFDIRNRKKVTSDLVLHSDDSWFADVPTVGTEWMDVEAAECVAVVHHVQ